MNAAFAQTRAPPLSASSVAGNPTGVRPVAFLPDTSQAELSARIRGAPQSGPLHDTSIQHSIDSGAHRIEPPTMEGMRAARAARRCGCGAARSRRRRVDTQSPLTPSLSPLFSLYP